MRGMALGAAGALALWPAGWLLPVAADALEDRLLLAALSGLAPLACLAAGIGVIARHRFLNAAAIDGANPAGDRTLTAANAYLQNTVEQVVLALPVYAVLAVALPPALVGTVPLMGLAFLAGRIAFARGYAGGAPARAVGFALTFYPSVVGLLVAIGVIAGRVLA